MNERVRAAYKQTTDAGIYPIDVNEMASGQGLRIKYFDPMKKKKSKLTDVSGMLDKDNKVIYVNVNDPIERQRFTIAHEFGHFLFGHSADEYGLNYRYDIPGETKGKKTPVERQADDFAAELLMPSPLVKKVVGRYESAKLTLNELAGMFGVSLQAMNNKLKNLNLDEKVIK